MLYDNQFYDYENVRLKSKNTILYYNTIPFGTLSHFIEYNFNGWNGAEGVFPQIMIECEAPMRESIAADYQSFINRFVDEKNKELDETFYSEIDEEYPYEPDYYFCCPEIRIFDSGLYIYAGVSCSVENPELEINPLIEPVEDTLKMIKKKYPEVIISVLLKYHFNFGYHYGNNYLWIKGNAEHLAAKQLDCAMRNFRWGDRIDYEELLDLAFELIDGLPADWIEVFWQHVPPNDAELRARLLQKIEKWKEEHPDKMLSPMSL